MTTPQEAAAIAEELLARDLPRRWAHTQGVARAARDLAHLAGRDAGLLEAAAWLHDIGYALTIATTGFHPLDGALHLTDATADPAVIALVAHHTNAMVEAEERGMTQRLRDFPRSAADEAIHDLLAYCDLTTSPDGTPTTIDARITEIQTRYPRNHAAHRAITRAAPELSLLSHRIIANCVTDVTPREISSCGASRSTRRAMPREGTLPARPLT